MSSLVVGGCFQMVEAVSQGVCVGGAAVWFSCSYCGPTLMGWQELGGELAMRIFPTVMSVSLASGQPAGPKEGLGSPCSVCVVSSLYLIIEDSHRGQTESRLVLGKKLLFVCCCSFLCSSSKITALPLVKCTEITICAAAGATAASTL